MLLYRIHKANADGWRVFPDFVERVRSFATSMSPELDADVLVRAIEEKFVQTPDLTFFIGVFDEGRMIGHLAAWIDSAFGHPYAFISQAHMDEPHHLDGLQREALAGLDQWVGQLNALYEQQGSEERIRYAEMWTPWDPRLWERYLRSTGRTSRSVRHVIRWDVSAPSSSVVETGNGKVDA